MQNNYCLPVLKSSKKDVLDTIQSADNFNYFEIWLDYIEDLDFDFVNHLLFQYRDKLIFVLRRLNLETTLMESQRRLSIISLMNNKDALLDLDVITQQEEISYLQNNGLKISLITSYHNYQQTPTDDKLLNIISIMEKYDPYIFKIATKCDSPKDAIRLLDLLITLKNKKKKIIVMGMGEYGTMTRIYGSLWGNEITFTPKVKTEATAPGQLTRNEMDIILNILNSIH